MKLSTLPLDSRLPSSLIAEADELRVTISMPTHPTAPEREQDPIRFRNLLREAEEALMAEGMRRPDAAALLEPATDLLDDGEFWRHQQRGLVMFLSRALAHFRKLPYDVPEHVHVNSYFAVRHVLPLLTSYVRFFLLAVSQSEVRMFASRGDALHEIELPGARFEEYERYLEPESSLQHHTSSVAAATRTSRTGLIYHGHGTDEPVRERAFEFFRRLDGSLRRLLRNETAPMILAGEQRILSVFRNACTYPHMANTAILGNTEHLAPHELLEKAREAMAPLVELKRKAGRRLFEAAKNESRASDDVEQVLLAAYEGKLDVLLARREAHVFGAYDDSAHAVRVHPDAQPSDDDLLELAVIHTLRHGGSVYVVEDDEMPNDAPAHGVLRRGIHA